MYFINETQTWSNKHKYKYTYLLSYIIVTKYCVFIHATKRRTGEQFLMINDNLGHMHTIQYK